MTNWDKEYLELCRKILNEGFLEENRTGINTIKIPEYNLHFDLQEEFPILTTKQLLHRQAVTEMLWIWQMGSNKVKDLHDRNVSIWDEWTVDKDGIYRIYEPYKEFDPDKEVEVMDPLSVPREDPFGEENEFKPKLDKNGDVMKAKSLIPGKTIKSAKYYGKKYAGTIGTAYGFITNRYSYAKDLINTIKKDPTSRRMVYSLWQNEFLRTAVLPSCVWSTEWDVTDGKLNLLVHQRSCDVPLGLPFNVTQYATFLKMIAQVTNYEPGSIDYSIKNAHIYVNQVDGIKEQLRREDRYNELLKCDTSELRKLRYALRYKINKLEETAKNDDELKALKKTKQYQFLDTEFRTVDMILDPCKPYMELNKDIDDFFKFDNSKELKDVKVLNYKHMGKIDIPIAQ